MRITGLTLVLEGDPLIKVGFHVKYSVKEKIKKKHNTSCVIIHFQNNLMRITVQLSRTYSTGAVTSSLRVEIFVAQADIPIWSEEIFQYENHFNPYMLYYIYSYFIKRKYMFSSAGSNVYNLFKRRFPRYSYNNQGTQLALAMILLLQLLCHSFLGIVITTKVDNWH